MTALLLLICITVATLLWPINRWVMRNQGTASVYGFYGCATAALLAGGIAFLSHQPVFEPSVWVIGAIMGVAFASGYWQIIMHCLKIGPVGPTVAMNNMGMLWPVVLGTLWLKPQPLSAWAILGLGLVSLAIIVMGFGSSRKGASDVLPTSTLSLRWFLWALLGWALAGISMTGQVAASAYVPDAPASIVFAFSTVAAVLLAFPAFRSHSWKMRRELVAGLVSGVLIVTVGTCTIIVLNFAGPEIVFPITVAMPAVLILLLGFFLYKERLGLEGLLACILGIAGVTILSLA